MKTEKQSLVSVIIPTRNRASLLKRAVRSALEQTWTNLEIVVVDDASSDDTPEVLQLLKANSAITVIRNSEPKGAAAARNTAIEHAAGTYIAGLDDDDEWHPQRIEKLVEAFDEGKTAFATSWDLIISENGRRTWKKPGVITPEQMLYYNRTGGQGLTKREYLLEIGGYDPDLPSAQDYDLLIRLTSAYGIAKVVPLPLQIIHAPQTASRISTHKNRIKGYYACYVKHKHRFNAKQRRYQLYRLRLEAGKKIGPAEFLRAVPFRLMKKEITRIFFL